MREGDPTRQEPGGARPVHRVVIVGGGFGGLSAARGLAGAPLRVTLVDRRNHHLFQPLLYQVATGGLAAANIASPLRSLLRWQTNAAVRLGEVTGIDVPGRRVLVGEESLDYDTLVLATGASSSYFGHGEWAEHAPGLKSLDDAEEIRRRIVTAFERAEWARDEAERAACTTFVVIGGGPTGVELAGSIAELARATAPHEFRNIDTTKARIVLVDGADRLLTSFSARLSAQAAAGLEKLGVEVRTNSRVSAVGPGSVRLAHPTGEETIEAATVLWAAGVTASLLGRLLADATGAALDGGGRVRVEADCALPGHPEIFAVGDMAHCPGPGGDPLPGMAPVAVQQGRHVARAIRDRLAGRPARPFHYRDNGSMATIGRSLAVARLGRLELFGFSAWLAWVFVHLLALIGLENRLLVLIQWAWSYFTWNRNARFVSRQCGGRAS